MRTVILYYIVYHMETGHSEMMMVGSSKLYYCPSHILYILCTYNNNITAFVCFLNEKTAYNDTIKFNGKYHVVLR